MDHESPPDRPYSRRERPAPRPLARARMEEMALAYVARFATSAAKLEAYLARKLRERGWEGDAPEEGAAAAREIVARFVELGYVDDAGFARMKAGSLLRRGFGARRIAQALGQDGIDEAIREEVAPEPAEARAAALALARKKGLGPFTRRGLDEEGRLDPALREKQIAAMLRAGHGMGAARAVIEAADVESLEAWAGEEE